MTHGSAWYDESMEAIRHRFGDDADLFAGILAATSAHSSVSANVKLAVKAFNMIKDTGTITREGFMKHHYLGILQVLEHGIPKGPKVGAFARALLGDHDAVVVDLWMCRWYGSALRAPTIKLRREIEAAIRIKATELGLSPRDTQAHIWCQVRGNSESYADYLRQGGLL